MAQPFVGQITLYPYSFAPYGWMDCVGQLLPISQYTALFSLLGTQFGGDGRSNFALPDLQGRVAVGMGTAPVGTIYDMGEAGGTETVTLTTATLGPHTHNLNAVTSDGTTNAPAGAVLAAAASGAPRDQNKGNIYNPTTTNTPLVAASVALAGNGLPHNNIQPMLVLRYCIAIVGVYPSRG
jgi:microcystin-dependent protein